MLRVVFREAHGVLVGVDAEGHAEWEEHGRDLVCAAASVLLQSLWLGLTEVVKVAVDGGWRSGDLHVTVKAGDARRSEVQTLFETTKRSIEALAAEYPENIGVRTG